MCNSLVQVASTVFSRETFSLPVDSPPLSKRTSSSVVTKENSAVIHFRRLQYISAINESPSAWEMRGGINVEGCGLRETRKDCEGGSSDAKGQTYKFSSASKCSTLLLSGRKQSQSLQTVVLFWWQRSCGYNLAVAMTGNLLFLDSHDVTFCSSNGEISHQPHLCQCNKDLTMRKPWASDSGFLLQFLKLNSATRNSILNSFWPEHSFH